MKFLLSALATVQLAGWKHYTLSQYCTLVSRRKVEKESKMHRNNNIQAKGGGGGGCLNLFSAEAPSSPKTKCGCETSEGTGMNILKSV